ncbi:MAG: glycoside hydrolase family 2 protein [Clostridiales bacterium]|jgi:beta-mannosidase|nr:glycoside hydrolase family 2 protein [Clostridiales bacterium]
MTRQDLGGVWRWRASEESAFHDGKVPGSALCDMLDAGLIQDPFWRDGEYGARDIFEQDFEYETAFALSPEMLRQDSAVLVFEGVDTLAEIVLNGEPLASTANMHRTWRFDVKARLLPGENTLRVLLRSPLRFIREAAESSDITYCSTGCMPGNEKLRKAHCMFGWDWGPQLPDAGIFRPVYLEFSQTARIEDLYLRQRHGENAVTVEAEITAEVLNPGGGPVTARAALTGPEGETLEAAAGFAPDGANLLKAVIKFEVENPKLWWPNGLGGQPLYTLTAELLCGGEMLDAKSLRVGLRTLELCVGPDEWGSEFAFKVNGVKFFAMGADYIPQDSLIPRVTKEKAAALVADCAKANFNMLRVWGGGYYPDSFFYDACDEYGILIWQDLMFACNVYALDEAGVFEENILAETRDNVRRLRHHACLALWCGNNEMEWGWHAWERLSESHHPRYKRDYVIIFEKLLADAVKQYDAETPWWPSSPSSGGAFDKPNAADYGDQHYWEVWHSSKPFTEYRKHYFRFCSEYGFQSFPSINTIKRFTLPEDRNIFSRVMESHQKNGHANGKILGYIADYFKYPKDLSSVAYISQILQLKAVQYGVEFWRQNRGRCMGSLYWQLNDCWPVASWASIDYYGSWKALHYGAKRFYAPVTVSAREKEELSTEIAYYVHNDSLAPRQCLLEVTLMDTDFRVLYREARAVSPAPLTAEAVFTVDFSPYIKDAAERRRVFARHRLTEEPGGERLGEGVTLFVKPKHFDYPAPRFTAEIKEEADRFAIRLNAAAFSHYTEISFEGFEPVLSDNYFDITDENGKVVFAEKSRLPNGADERTLTERLRVRGVRDSYEAE